VENVHHNIGSAIQQNKVSAYQHMRALRGRRRQPPFQVFGTRLEAFLEARRKRTSLYKLFFQPRGQTVSLGESWREIVLVLVIPSAHSFAVVTFVVALVLVVIIAMFFVTLSVSVSMPLGQREIACEHEDPNRKGNHPFCRAHNPLRS
jgi:hypothetical protein